MFFKFTKEEVNKYFDEALKDKEYVLKAEEIHKKEAALREELERTHRRVLERIVKKHREENTKEP